MAQLLKTAYPLPELAFGDGDWRKSAHEIAFQKLYESDTPMISFDVGDGAAYYVIKSMTPLKLQFVPYCDAYRADPILIRGLRRADVERMLDMERILGQ